MLYAGSKRLIGTNKQGDIDTFVRYDGLDFILTTEGAYGQTNSIKLTGEMLKNLDKFTNLLDKELG